MSKLVYMSYFYVMLSILIPIYNQDVRPLVYTLAKQCQKLNITYQILCFDDFSDHKYKDLNKELAFKFNINYTEMSENLGRSRIRNWLGNAAYNEYLLFLDGDSSVKNKNFIATYVENMNPMSIISGGRIYSKNPPRGYKKLLHWRYGTKRESLKASKRNKSPYLNFHSNNFIIPAKIFENHKFDEKIAGYGYEDLLYAVILCQHQVKLSHIDNPVIHDGLEINTKFLEKNKKATLNLASLYQAQKIRHTRLIDHFERLKHYRLLPVFERYYEKYHERIEQNLLSKDPSVLYFNLWKLNILAKALINPKNKK